MKSRTHAPRRLVLNAHKLAYDNLDEDRLLLTVSDVTEARAAEVKPGTIVSVIHTQIAAAEADEDDNAAAGMAV